MAIYERINIQLIETLYYHIKQLCKISKSNIEFLWFYCFSNYYELLCLIVCHLKNGRKPCMNKTEGFIGKITIDDVISAFGFNDDFKPTLRCLMNFRNSINHGYLDYTVSVALLDTLLKILDCFANCDLDLPEIDLKALSRDLIDLVLDVRDIKFHDEYESSLEKEVTTKNNTSYFK